MGLIPVKLFEPMIEIGLQVGNGAVELLGYWWLPRPLGARRLLRSTRL